MTLPKQILNASEVDPNKILPIKYEWARMHYKAGVANNWVPEEIPMQQDIETWKKRDALSENERRMVLWNLGFFSTAESLTANNIALSIYKYITNPEARQYLLRQAYEEAVHTEAFLYCCDSLGLNPDELYNMYLTIPSIKAKDDFVLQLTKAILDPNFNTAGVKNIQQFVYDLIGYYVIMEGIFFYAGFAMMLHLLRSNRMVGVGEQFQYILRDESVHLAFGADLINTIVAENPYIWTNDFKDAVTRSIMEGVYLESQYARDALPTNILGLSAEMVNQYMQYIGDRRLERINLKRVYDATNPFPWMSEIADLKKEKNFFETRVIDYKHRGALVWE